MIYGFSDQRILYDILFDKITDPVAKKTITDIVLRSIIQNKNYQIETIFHSSLENPGDITLFEYFFFVLVALASSDEFQQLVINNSNAERARVCSYIALVRQEFRFFVLKLDRDGNQTSEFEHLKYNELEQFISNCVEQYLFWAF
jgi:hypothetical protein